MDLLNRRTSRGQSGDPSGTIHVTLRLLASLAAPVISTVSPTRLRSAPPASIQPRGSSRHQAGTDAVDASSPRGWSSLSRSRRRMGGTRRRRRRSRQPVRRHNQRNWIRIRRETSQQFRGVSACRGERVSLPRIQSSGGGRRSSGSVKQRKTYLELRAERGDFALESVDRVLLALDGCLELRVLR